MNVASSTSLNHSDHDLTSTMGAEESGSEKKELLNDDKEVQERENLESFNLPVPHDEVVSKDQQEATLENDIFTLMFLANRNSLTFIFSVSVFILQMVVLAMISYNLMKETGDFFQNPFRIPINNEWDVILAQGCAIVIATFFQVDCLTSLANINLKYEENAIASKGYFNASRSSWIVSNICRFLEGLISMFVSFIFIVQSSSVIDIFLNFAAVSFVSELDDIAFRLAIGGFLGRNVQEDAKYARDLKFHKKRTYVSRFTCGLTTFFALGFIIGWMVIVVNQMRGKYLMNGACKRVRVVLPDKVYNLPQLMREPFSTTLASMTNMTVLINLDKPAPLFYAYFSGTYRIPQKGNGEFETENDRFVYYEWPEQANKQTSGRFSYCAAEQAWVFTIKDFDDKIPRGRCGQWLLRSAETTAFFLDEVSQSEWTVWTGFVESTSLEITCMDCTRLKDNNLGCNYNGKCNIDGSCSCNEVLNGEKWFGDMCEALPPCKTVDAFSFGEKSNEYAQVGHYMSVSDAANQRVLAYGRPIYWNKRNTSFLQQNFLLYTGDRWFATEWLVTDICSSPPCTTAIFAEFFKRNFHAYWFNTWKSNNIYISERTDQFTPVGLEWFTVGRNRAFGGDFGPFGETYEEGVLFHCFQTDCSRAKVCGNSGFCNDKTNPTVSVQKRCNCINNSSGYFCQIDAKHPYVKEQIENFPDVQCNEYFCDYFKDQDPFSGFCPQYCNQTAKRKKCWRTQLDCPGKPEDRGSILYSPIIN
mmetsp:Transcript_39249/g.57734  ORF Transcript_39249/g.57734 Transcript_39249/m.57734 type:complete len:756 (-) Transcript_39249:62-2329(-)|eukprot:CAMPEP_0195518016 /NCGR_PEP_ID=MMETSP0794_2-20130614/11946_1 /TAXON_ID=515487 /ORGANISM="Stephanopyxis turris, Strain CCMP 815" /LENGTH=755 /DNA_ID=CAMNT_0040646907 /DNA_START=50 /DNA_END=2317 /DNA_ORIENTATION=-